MRTGSPSLAMQNINTTSPSEVPRLNDLLRRTGCGGPTMVTTGIAALPEADRMCILEAVASFDDFSEHNDPYGEHDCAVIQVAGYSVLWKIDYFDSALQFASPDPADPAVTCRVLTIMLAEEY